MDRTSAPTESYFPTVSIEDWAAFSAGYADLVEGLVEAADDPAPALAGSASSRAPRERRVPTRGPRVERPRPLVLAS